MINQDKVGHHQIPPPPHRITVEDQDIVTIIPHMNKLSKVISKNGKQMSNFGNKSLIEKKNQDKKVWIVKRVGINKSKKTSLQHR